MDALSRTLPQYPHDAYLNGYVQGIKSMPLKLDGTICYPRDWAILRPDEDEF